MNSAPFQRQPSNESTVARLVVPRQNQSLLMSPARGELADCVATNLRRCSESNFDLQGQSWPSLREETQTAVLAEAVAYTSLLVGERINIPSRSPLIVTGHQPELFHSGVWAKNFAAGWLAGQSRGLALNLIIDNDTVTTTRIKAPVGTPRSPAMEWIPFDATKPQQPWEEATISDPDCFRSFDRRVTEIIRAHWNYQPLVSTGWSAAIRHSRASSRLADCLAAARAGVERSHGLKNLEVPMSRVCSTLPFCRFTAFLLARLPRFHTVYNQSVREYRQQHHLKSRTHPVPELESADGWFEAPFWVWRAGDKRRERPFARQIASEVELRDTRGVFARFPLTEDKPLDGAASVLFDLNARGIRLRTRALTTTLFARVCLADLFIHGIGGAKYDTMTDQICRRFLGMDAPRFATVSATVHLPLAEPFPVSVADHSFVLQQIRDLRYNPDRHMSKPTGTSVDSLIHEKGKIIASLDARHPTRTQHRRLAEINAELFGRLDGVSQSLAAKSELIRHQLQANSILLDREFSWCLQPEQMVSSFLGREFPG